MSMAVVYSLAYAALHCNCNSYADTWLAGRPQVWRDGVEVVAMDGFTGFKTATTEELPGPGVSTRR
jgi:hypothetical protein